MRRNWLRRRQLPRPRSNRLGRRPKLGRPKRRQRLKPRRHKRNWRLRPKRGRRGRKLRLRH